MTRTLSLLTGLVVSGAIFFAVLSESVPTQGPSYAEHFDTGLYRCFSCSAPLFRSDDKFDSTTRWPSFRQAIDGAVEERPDWSYGLDRTEIRCAGCGSHLGHVFPDGRLTGDTHPDAGLRFCVLSAALRFEGEAREPADGD